MPDYRLQRPTINGRRSDVWYVVWTDARRSRRRSTGTTDLSAAKGFLAQFEALLAAPPERFTIGDLCDAYQLNREQDPRVAYPKAIANSLNHVRAHFGGLPPSMLSRATVRSYVSQRRRLGRSDATITKELGFLRQALKHGVREGWMRDEPKVEVPGGSAPRERFLTRAEFACLYFHASPLHLRTFLALAIDTLARGKHILALTWGRIDFERGIVWYVPHRPGSKKKTQSAPMSNRLRGALERAYEARQGAFVVEWRGERVKSVRKAYERAVRLAGLVNAHRHDVRRSGASWAVQDGVSFDMVAVLLGDSVEMTQRTYAQFAPGHLRPVVDAIAGKVRA